MVLSSIANIASVVEPTRIDISNRLPVSPTDDEAYHRNRKVDSRQWVVAAPADSINFQIRNHEAKPKAKRWDHIISYEAHVRNGHSLMKAAEFLSIPGIISLGTGLPSSEYFPFEEISVKVPAVGHFSEADTRNAGVISTIGKYDVANNKSIFDISTAFNYGQSSGSPQLLRWITEHTDLVHNPPYQDWRCAMSIGSTSALDMALRMLSQPGDMMLYEEYTFTAAVEAAIPLGVRSIGVPVDSEGLLPDAMDDILSNWDIRIRGSRKPHLLYTIPTGQNPTGATQSAARRRSIYAICQKHNLFIIEDEPYYFLQMQPHDGTYGSSVSPSPSHASFLQSLVPSLLSMDRDGRVMRLDSFSKVICPGARIGWVTASHQIIERYKKHAGVSTQGPSGISQLLLWKLVDGHWGHSGYLDWLIYLRMEYSARRDIILSACEKHLPKQVVSWRPPMAGMFHWIQVDFHQHPHYPVKDMETIEEQLFLRIINHGTLVMRGSWFYADSKGQHDKLFFRATYAAAPAQKIDEGIRRLGDAIREEFSLETLGAKEVGEVQDTSAN